MTKRKQTLGWVKKNLERALEEVQKPQPDLHKLIVELMLAHKRTEWLLIGGEISYMDMPYKRSSDA